MRQGAKSPNSLLEITRWLISGQIDLKTDACVQFEGGGVIPVVGVEPDASGVQLPLLVKSAS